MAKKTGSISIGEIFKNLEKAKSKKQRVEILQEHKANLGLTTILRLQFDSRFKFALPEGTPEGINPNHNPIGLGLVSIESSVKKFYLFLEGGSPGLKQVKREALFLELLEALDKQESALMVLVKDKKVDCGLTRALVDEVFPGLIPPTA